MLEVKMFKLFIIIECFVALYTTQWHTIFGFGRFMLTKIGVKSPIISMETSETFILNYNSVVRDDIIC